ncbi:GreA/GreB family elongation factor [Flavisolibacter sp. BT320]|jgi:regulator of nucleoside diphosphate kinase|nr:GreA/GreB family elongation factor [Flavisolibacter longurius]
MQKTAIQLTLSKNDYEIIMLSLKSNKWKMTCNQHDAEELEAELKKAKVVEDEELPDDVVRLNSYVTIKDEKADKMMEFMVVTPEKADIKQRKISIMSPLGVALIGYPKGEQVSWQVPAGRKTFTILDVRHSVAS